MRRWGGDVKHLTLALPPNVQKCVCKDIGCKGIMKFSGAFRQNETASASEDGVFKFNFIIIIPIE